MIRRRLRRRWQSRQGRAAILCGFRTLVMWPWLDRATDWHVARFDMSASEQTWWSRLVGRPLTWLDEWRMALAFRQPWRTGEWERLSERIEAQDPAPSHLEGERE